MSELRQSLREMGFSANRIEAAVRNTSGDNLEEAIQWIEDHQAKFDADEARGVDEEDPIDVSELNEEQLSKLKRAAAKEEEETGHSLKEKTVEEPEKPRTEEEKAAKLAELQEKAAARKAEKEKKEAEEKRRNDRLMLKKEKDYNQIVEEQRRKEAVKEAEKKKKEAKDDAAAKKRIKDLIEQDKRDRQKKREGGGGTSEEDKKSEAEPKKPAPAPTASKPQVQKTESKIRFRLPDNTQQMMTFPLTDTVADVIHKFSSEHGQNPSSVQLVSTFPTQTFTVNDTQPLKEAGLVNASLMVKYQ